MSEIRSYFGEVSGAIRALFGLSRRSRTREHLREDVALYAALVEHEALEIPSETLAKVIEIQANRLLDVVTKRRRDWNWPSFVLAEVIAGIAAWIGYIIWRPHGVGPWVGLVADVAVGGLFAAAGFGVLLQRPDSN